MKKNTTNKLSERQLMILNRISMGETSSEIAEELGKSMRTIETVRAIIIKKLGGKNISHAITIAFRTRILRLKA
jgi:DNA-binding NarL/FixJ family response regulator